MEWAMDLTGIGGIIILILDIFAIVMILQSSAKSIEKLIWALVVFLLPLIGLIIWYFAGPGKKPF
jgi:Phospholipase_D-nuclease N-terminal